MQYTIDRQNEALVHSSLQKINAQQNYDTYGYEMQEQAATTLQSDSQVTSRRLNRRYSSVLKMNEVFAGPEYRIKDREKARLFQVIQDYGPISQKQIIGKHNFRPVELSNGIRELEEDRLIVLEHATSNNRAGRPEKFYRMNAHRTACLSIYTDSFVFRGVAIDLLGNVIATNERSTRNSWKDENVSEIHKEMAVDLRNQLSEGTLVAGLGISVPGNVDESKRMWNETSRSPYIDRIDYTKLEDQLSLPIKVQRDLDGALVHEIRQRNLASHKSCILFHWGLGLGCAVTSRGQLVHSNFGRIGNIGRMRLFPLEQNQSSIRTLNDYVSISNLITPLRKLDPTLSVDEREVSALSKSYNLLEIPEIRKAIEIVSLMLSNLTLLLYPDHIFLLGPLFESELIMGAIKETYLNEQLVLGVQREVDLHPVSDGYSGCVTSVAHALFLRQLRTLLRARS